MITVKIAHLGTLGTEAVLREVNSQLAAVTPVGRELEIQAGVQVMERLDGMGPLPVGGAVITPAGGLAASFIIHAVVQSEEEAISEEGVRQGLLNGLRRATEWGIESLSLPPMGCGAGNLSAEAAAMAIVPMIREYSQSAELPREVIIAVANEYEEATFTAAVGRAFSEPPARDM